MPLKKSIAFLVFLLAVLWGIRNLKESSDRLGLAAYNTPVLVKVVSLPLCGRSNIIKVQYEGSPYKISINKNDCIQQKYSIGDLISATYNPKTNEINPNNFVGSYRLSIVYILAVVIIFVLYILMQKWKYNNGFRV